MSERVSDEDLQWVLRQYETDSTPHRLASDVVALSRDLSAARARSDRLGVEEICRHEHKFTKRPDHPKKDGESRCPHCMAEGLELARASLDEALGLLRIVGPYPARDAFLAEIGSLLRKVGQ